ncbi:hypothetical protein L486_04919 [Kwoniella mangroviensis CBS 10435]|uniref:Uncharacterized protein n=1 Tax=Kwoniella mangroviensis CBS 10435 TaxID=1331196 RepID=A0A1B9IPP6_9TREE|nr:hypothetical protein L486_04919 [Kwoniella mangroviensis CBS 10435]
MPQQSAQSSSGTDPTAICSCKRTDQPYITLPGSQQFCEELCKNDPSCHASLSSHSQNMQGNYGQGGTNEGAFETFDSMASHFEGAQQGSSENLGGNFNFSAPSRPAERGTAAYDRIQVSGLLDMQAQVASMSPEQQETFHQWLGHYTRTGEEWYNPDDGQHNPNAG